ncbi:hypothetical protein GTW51_20605 [Aurantimonas aggregata]|uniref:Uncharacterized protein n=1 Tax=Aurantimonas aggregata TaxID=2047720 RepID=A0A6L9MMJ3_9HYPH|nr:hypothetical protein [Aurantimonas aggregata]NDV89077.1 hypothetical protein [Aurantimonas aggregata]
MMIVAPVVSGTGEPWVAIAATTIGTTRSSVANWACGRLLSDHRDHRWFPVSSPQIDRFSGLFQGDRMGSLLFAWARIVGETLTVVAGDPARPSPLVHATRQDYQVNRTGFPGGHLV